MPGSGVGKLREAESMAENGRARSRERVIESERSGEGEEAGRMKQQRSCNYGCVMKIDGCTVAETNATHGG